jgi:hypothetical protein
MPFGGHFAEAVRRARQKLITAVPTALTTRKRTAAAFVTWKVQKRLHTHRAFDDEQDGLNQKAPTCGAFAEPSSGLEPETPSLPWFWLATAFWAVFGDNPLRRLAPAFFHELSTPRCIPSRISSIRDLGSWRR